MQVYRETLRVNLDRVVVPFPKEGISDFVRPLDLHGLLLDDVEPP